MRPSVNVYNMARNGTSATSGSDSLQDGIGYGPANSSHCDPEMSDETHGNRTVNFDYTDADKDVDKKKFFTGKYDDRQRKKIKHRIKVENWLWEQLLIMYDCEVSNL